MKLVRFLAVPAALMVALGVAAPAYDAQRGPARDRPAAPPAEQEVRSVDLTAAWSEGDVVTHATTAKVLMDQTITMGGVPFMEVGVRSWTVMVIESTVEKASEGRPTVVKTAYLHQQQVTEMRQGPTEPWEAADADMVPGSSTDDLTGVVVRYTWDADSESWTRETVANPNSADLSDVEDQPVIVSPELSGRVTKVGESWKYDTSAMEKKLSEDDDTQLKSAEGTVTFKDTSKADDREFAELGITGAFVVTNEEAGDMPFSLTATSSFFLDTQRVEATAMKLTMNFGVADEESGMHVAIAMTISADANLHAKSGEEAMKALREAKVIGDDAKPTWDAAKPDAEEKDDAPDDGGDF